MAFAPDHGGGSGLGWISSTSAPTWNHWVAGSDRFIAVEIHTFNGSGAIGATSVTCDGVAMTLAGGISANLEGSHQRGEIWWMDNPGTGTTVPIVVTLSGTTDFFVGFSSSYTGKTSTGIAGFAATQNLSASTSSPTNNVTVPFSDCWLIGGAYSRAGSAPSAGTGTVMRSYADVGQIFGDSDGYVGTGSQSLAFTAASSTWPAVLTIAVSEANTGGGSSGLDLDPDPIALSGALSVSGDIESVIKRWRVPTTAPEDTDVHVVIMSGTSPTYSIVTQGVATVDASGNAEIAGSGTIGTKRLAFVHNFDDDTDTVSIYGGPGIAELIDAG